VSLISAREIAIKKTLGKLLAPENLKEAVAARLPWMPRTSEHIRKVKGLRGKSSVFGVCRHVL